MNFVTRSFLGAIQLALWAAMCFAALPPVAWQDKGVGPQFLPASKTVGIHAVEAKYLKPAHWSGSLSLSVRQKDASSWPELIRLPNCLSLGTVRPTAAGVPTMAQSGDWARCEFTYAFAAADGRRQRLRMWGTRLSPAILFQAECGRVTLFSGQAGPRFLALGTASGVKVLDADRVPGREGQTIRAEKVQWILAWYGQQSGVRICTLPYGHAPSLYGDVPGAADPIEPIRRRQAAGPAPPSSPPLDDVDLPLLLTFERSPASLRMTREDGLQFDWGAAGGYFAIMPLLDWQYPAAKDTEQWRDGLPRPIVDRCRGWSQRLACFPLSVRETYGYDRPSRTIKLHEDFTFLTVREGGRPWAPLPPMLALAREAGLSMQISPEPGAAELFTYLGPYCGVPGVTRYEVAFPELGKYAAEARQVGATGNEPAELRGQLDRTVQAMAEAGHLQPWVLLNGPEGSFDYRLDHPTWSNPGETVGILSRVMGAVSPAVREQLAGYLKRERATYPPETVSACPLLEGWPRTRYLLDSKRLNLEGLSKGRRLHEEQRAVPVQNLYALAEYYRLLPGEQGQLPRQWPALKAVADPHLAYQDWASMGFLSRNGSHFMTFLLRHMSKGDFEYGRGDVMEANAWFAGMVGLARLAGLAHDDETCAVAQGLVAKAAVLRYAMAKYNQYRYRHGFLKIPGNDPQWQLKVFRGRFSPDIVFYEGTFYTEGQFYNDHWLEPVDDVRQVYELNQFCVFMTHLNGRLDGVSPLAVALVPELGRFLGDFARPETARFIKAVEHSQPDWWVAFAENVYGADGRKFIAPEQSHQLFLAKAWALGASSEELRRYLDIPWVQVGDLYYLDKLAETIKAYRGVTWAPWP